MFSKPSTQRFELSQLPPQPIVLTPAETKHVAGGDAGTAPYNTPGNPAYGPTGGDGGASHSGHDRE
jgi:hypothetical protein